MAIVLLNGDVTGLEYPANTWGELLDELDEQCAVRGDVVIAVRFGGAEHSAFRTPEALAHALEANAEVLIETARPTDLIRQTLDAADAATPAIVEAAVGLGGLYRASEVSAANRALPAFAESLGTLIVLTTSVAQGADVDLSAVGEGGASVLQTVDNLLAHTEVLLAAQRAGNWTQAADVLDSDIAAAVRRWPLVLAAIREASPTLTEPA